ncbi:MAG: leucine-rich repeat domain-containing protein [Bacteroidales bacterium]|jgi:internalin A|nr:leucine-rich repeat domain-containing protein [Bacteroidales bacterium]
MNENNKPETIVELEKLYGISLQKIDAEKFDSSSLNCYAVNNLDEITHLNLKNNQIGEIKGLDKLTNLQELNLSSNKISEIKGLDKLTNLQILYLYNNQISEIKGLNKLTNLQELDLRYNYIGEIKGLNKLKNLRELKLSDNQISEIKGLESIINGKKFNRLLIHNNPFLKESNLVLTYDHFIYNNRYNHRDTILKYFSDIKLKQIKGAEITVVLPAKVMFWGNHTAGKTTFWQYLKSETIKDFIKEAAPGSTHILNIYKYPKESNSLSEIDAMIYDFGGQDYYHGLYQAFFSKEAINVLFWDSSNNENKVVETGNGNSTRHFTWDYWLYQFHYRRQKQEEAPPPDSILLVQTHADKYKRKNYTDEFSDFNIVDEFYVSLNKSVLKGNKVYQSALQHLKTTLLYEIEQKKKKKKKKKKYFQFKYYVDFLQYILKQDEAECVRIENLLKEHYKREKQKNESDEDMLSFLRADLTLMHQQGLVLYYSNTENLKDYVWLNPAMTVENIYKEIFSSDIIKEYKGNIPENDFTSKVQDLDLKIIDLLINEKVIFHDIESKKYIIPSYLPLSENDDSYDMITFGLQEPAFVLKFMHFIPFGLINQLICLYGGFPDKKILWRDQLIFTFGNNYKVWIRLLFSTLTIEVYISHEKEKKESKSRLEFDEVKRAIFLNIIDLYWGKEVVYKDHEKHEDEYKNMNRNEQFIDNVEGYLKDKKDKSISSPEDMYLSIDKKIFVKHKQLETMQFSANSIAGYSLNEAGELNLSSPENISVTKYKIYSNNKKLKGMKKVFVSYSKADVKEKDEFIKHTKTMQDESLIEKPWADDCIEFSDKWDQTIKSHIDDCDIMIFLISVDFLNTDYIRNNEVKRVLKDMENDENDENDKILVPIVIKPCDWEGSDIAKYQFALKGKCISLNENNKYFVQESTDAERADSWVKIIKEMRRKIFDKEV